MGSSSVEVGRWLGGGLSALTGDAGPAGQGALVPPAGAVERLVGRVDELGRRAGLDDLGLDPVALLGERAAIAGLARQGAVSCGGATRLLEAADGWVAVSLAREDDVELVPAWFPSTPVAGAAWDVVAPEVARRPARDVVERGRLLGLPVARLGEVVRDEASPVIATRVAGDGEPTAVADLVVVDLSSLWAGPLVGHLLGAHGARVVKVESTARPDGARRGPPAFFDLLHAGQESVALDLGAGAGLDALRALLRAADVVIEGSRPRALEQWGIDAVELVRGDDGPRIWVSITALGRGPGGRDAVGFGDDAAVAGGLVAWGSDGRPRFVGDAIADPLTGLAATGAVRDALVAGGRWLLDASLARTAAWVALDLDTTPWLDAGDAPLPSARRARGAAPTLGAHTDEVLTALGLAR